MIFDPNLPNFTWFGNLSLIRSLLREFHMVIGYPGFQRSGNQKLDRNGKCWHLNVAD